MPKKDVKKDSNNNDLKKPKKSFRKSMSKFVKNIDPFSKTAKFKKKVFNLKNSFDGKTIKVTGEECIKESEENFINSPLNDLKDKDISKAEEFIQKGTIKMNPNCSKYKKIEAITIEDEGKAIDIQEKCLKLIKRIPDPKNKDSAYQKLLGSILTDFNGKIRAQKGSLKILKNGVTGGYGPYFGIIDSCERAHKEFENLLKNSDQYIQKTKKYISELKGTKIQIGAHRKNKNSPIQTIEKDLKNKEKIVENLWKEGVIDKSQKRRTLLEIGKQRKLISKTENENSKNNIKKIIKQFESSEMKARKDLDDELKTAEKNKDRKSFSDIKFVQDHVDIDELLDLART